MPIHPQTAPRSEERGAVRARSRASPGGSPLPPREQRKHLLGEGHEAGSRRWEWKRPARRGTAPAPRTSAGAGGSGSSRATLLKPRRARSGTFQEFPGAVFLCPLSSFC